MAQPAQPQPFSLDVKKLFDSDKPVGSKHLLETLGAERKGTPLALVLVDFLPANPMLAGDIALQLEQIIAELGKVKKLDVVLRSTGGVAEIPWKIISVLRCFCDELEVIVPRSALSGATHIAIGADNLVMGPFSSLGSVDPTRNHPLLPRDPQGNPTPASVQDLKHCLNFLKANLLKDEPLGPLVGQLFNQVHPLAIGAIEQSYELARLITKKVLSTRKSPLSAEPITDQLAGKYFSHGYPISATEVQSDLKLPVTKAEPGDSLFKAIEALNSFYTGAFEKQIAVTQTPVPLTFRITGFIETTKSRRILCQVFNATGQNAGGAWISEGNS
jgi:hypothetical protein